MADNRFARLLEPGVGAFSGVLFGLGLGISEMVNPARVVGFLDITGNWDPTLGVVMLGALAVTIPGFRLVLRRNGPLLAAKFNVPTRTELDRPLLLGAVLFGVGWGLGGFCPGPALTALVSGHPEVFVFVGAMLLGAWIHDRAAGRPTLTRR